MSKSTSTVMNWIQTLWTRESRSSGRSRARRVQRPMQAEMLEVRELLSAILLDFPGINGDATGAGTTANDTELAGFSWGFARATPTSTPVVEEITFQKMQDGASNDLYAHSSFATLGSKAAVLRLVDQAVPGGDELLRFDLTNPRVTSYSASSDRAETGSLIFSQVNFTESLVTTNRTASFNLLSGAASGTAPAGSSNIDVGGNLNLETVMTIGTQKFIIDSFEWKAGTGGNVLNVPGSLGTPTSTNFNISRDVDSGTAGFLSRAAAGTNLGTVTISDRRPVTTGSVTANKSVMEFKLYDAVILDFGLNVLPEGDLTNKLGLTYSKIELVVNQFDSKGLAGATLTTTWDQALNKVTSATTFGIADPSIADSAEVASFLDFGSLGRVRYDEIDWSITKPTTITPDENGGTITQDTTTASSLAITLPAGSSTPALIGNLVAKTVLPTVAAKEQNKSTPLSSLNTFTYTNSAITDFSISSKGTEDPKVTFNLDFQNAAEAFNARGIPVQPSGNLITGGNFNEITQASTGALDFGDQDVDSEFELVIKEAGITSEIPVLTAAWNVGRSVTRSSNGNISASTPLQSTFDLTIPRGVHSPGLLNAVARGTKIDEAFVYRYKTVNGDKIETYRWQLTDAFLTAFAAHMLPGNSAEEVDTLSLLPSKIILKTDKLDATGADIGDLSSGWDFTTSKVAVISGAPAGDFGNTKASTGVLLYQFGSVSDKTAPIDSYRWGALLPVDETTTQGVRPLGNPDANDLVLNFRQPSTRFLAEALNGALKDKVTVESQSKVNSQEQYILELNNSIIRGYSYSDKVDSTDAKSSASVFVGNNVKQTYTPRSSTGTLLTPLAVSWNLSDDTTTQTGGFGGFQFANNGAPETVLEFFDGTTRSQVEASAYSFGTSNSTFQSVGKSGASVPLATAGIAKPGTFTITTRLDRTTPALLNAIALKTKLPEIKIVERRLMNVAGSTQFLPFREWLLKDVYIEQLANTASEGDRLGSLTLSLNPGSATSTLITYNASGTAIPASRAIDFVTPPATSGIAPINMVSTDAPRVVDLVTRFTDESQASSTLKYAVTIVSGANLFDSVSINSINRLVVDAKAGQGGVGQLRIDATDAFGMVTSTLVNVSVDANGIAAAPAGTNGTSTTSEDVFDTITAADFGFTDPNDFPANTFTGIVVSSLPAKGTLTLNNISVTLNQSISITDINAGLLRYIPLAHENGNNYASIGFRVQDNGSTANGGMNLDPTPKTLTFNVTAANDAPVLTNTITNLPAINEDATNPAGILVSSVAGLISDVDVGAVKGIAVISSPSVDGVWQYSLDGTTWQNFGTLNSSNARLLASDATTRIRFLPAANFNGNSPLLAYVAWDQTAGTAGSTFNVTAGGGTTAFSGISSGFAQVITPVNDAPTLNNAGVFLTQINEDTINPAGALVSDLLTGMSDADAGAARGMAVRSVQNSGGVWHYSLNGGANWTPFGSLTAATVRLLPADANTRVRFVPNLNFNGIREFSFYAWDQTSGTAGGTADLSLASAKGGATAFSTDIELTFARQVITAVNDIPNIAAPTTAALVVNTPLVFSTANGNALSVSDIDAGSGELEIKFTLTNARFTLSTLTGITVTAGTHGTSAFTVRGTLTALNAALQGSSLIGNEDYFGTGNLRLDVNDLGNTGSGGPKTRGRTIPLTISALPDAISLGELNAVSATGFESGSFTAGTTASRFYSFTLPAAADVRLVLSGLTGNASLRLLTTSGFLIGQGINPGNFIENVLVSPLAAGTYIVAVKPTGLATSFNLSVSTATTSDDLIVNANDLGTLNAATRPTVFVSDSLSGVADRQDYFKFTTTAASPLRVSFSGLSDNYDIHLLNANGAVVSSNVLPGTNIKTIARSNLAAGTYFIRVSGLANRDLTQYDLTISLASTIDDLISQAFSLGTLDATTLPVVRRVAPSVGGANVQDYHSFVLATTSDVRVNLTGLSQDIDIQLLDSFGRPIGFGSNGGNNSENVLATSLAAGTYYVRVAPFQNAGSTYELSVAIDPLSDDLLSNAINMGALSATVPTIQRTGNVNFTSDRTDYYSFTLGATTDVRVNLSGLSGDADIVLEDSFGRLITSSSQSGNSFENLIATGLTAGTYSIRVFTGSATTSTNYLLAVSQLTALDDLITNATMLGTLTSGTLPTVRTVGSVGGSDIQDYHRFNLTTAGNLRFALSNMLSDLDVELLDQFGQVIVSGTQSGNTIERVLTPTLAVGTYYIRVFQPISGGPVSSYNLEITTDFNGDDIIGPRTNLGFLASTPLTSSGSVVGTADIQDYFSFTLTSTRNVRFQLTGLSADIDIQVFNQFGNLIGSGTNGGSTSEDITLNGLLSGVYYIRILPFNNAVSSYSLSVSGV